MKFVFAKVQVARIEKTIMIFTIQQEFEKCCCSVAILLLHGSKEESYNCLPACFPLEHDLTLLLSLRRNKRMKMLVNHWSAVLFAVLRCWGPESVGIPLVSLQIMRKPTGVEQIRAPFCLRCDLTLMSVRHELNGKVLRTLRLFQ